MKKIEFIEKYGEAAYDEYKAKCREKQKERYWKLVNEDREGYNENQKKYQQKYHASKRGRAQYLFSSYKQFDQNRGLQTTITPEFIREKIFTGACIYCGERDWSKLGCDRIDNTRGHEIDNVVCACGKCNVNRGGKEQGWYKENLRVYNIEEKREIERKRYQERKEELKEYNKKYIASMTREEYLEKRRESYRRNREKSLAYQNEYNKRNKERIREYQKDYYQKKLSINS